MANTRPKTKISLFILPMLMIHGCSCLFPEKLWISCTVDVLGLEGSSARTASHEVSSLFKCASLASRASWAYLFCYSQPDRKCSLWDELSLSPGNVVKDPTLGATPCKTLLHPVAECKRLNGGVVSAGEVITSSFCSTVEEVCCADGTFYGKTSTGAPRLSTCEPPFTQKSFGCIMETPKLSGWCETRQHCLSNGGDLYVPDTTKQWTDILAYAGDTWYYVGSWKEFGKWRWLSSDRDPTSSGDWQPSQPNNAPVELCGHIFMSGKSGLADYNCDGSIQAICEVTIVP